MAFSWKMWTLSIVGGNWMVKYSGLNTAFVGKNQSSDEKMSDKTSVMIEAVSLSKYYGNFAAVENVSFQVREGEVVAFLGPNGAGKSTTMKLLTGYLAPSRGTARIAGFAMDTDRLAGAAQLGYLPENGPLYPDETPRSILHFFAGTRGLTGSAAKTRIDEIIERCRLGSVVGKPIGKLSKGYRQRVGMAQALLHNPKVLILDEPTTGLDPNQIEEVRSMLRELGKDRTILLSTHILQEVEAVCSRVLFIDEGELKFDGSVESFRAGAKTLDERFRQLSATVS